MELSWEKYKFPIVIILLTVLMFVVFLINSYNKGGGLPALSPQSSPVPLGPPEPEGIGSEIYQNPGSEVPQTNPFEAKTNPFEETKVNPYKDAYKNPFD